MPRLRILAGPTPDQLVPIQANSGKPTRIASDAFEGEVAVYIKGFADTEGRVGDSEYFEKRSGVTWSIQVQGAFHSRLQSFVPSNAHRSLPHASLCG